MRKRRVIPILIFGVVVLVGMIVFGAFRDREPEYEGKKLSEWVDVASRSASTTWVDLVSDVGQTNIFGIIGLPAREFEEPIRNMGTNALPYLLKWVGYVTPRWQLQLDHWIPRPLTERLFHARQKERRAHQALMALQVLGPEARGGIRELTRLFYLRDGTWAQQRALIALDSLGALALPTFIGAVTNNGFIGRIDIINRVGEKRGDARIAIPALLTLLDDPHDGVRIATTNALRRIDPQALERNTERH